MAQLDAIASQIVTAYQDGTFSDIVALEVLGMSVVSPPPEAGADEWLEYVQSEVGYEDRALKEIVLLFNKCILLHTLHAFKKSRDKEY